MPVKFGFVLPQGDARQIADLARDAEAAGWDGIFVWEPVWGIDAWVSLAAAAMQTQRIRLGTLLTPVSRLRPWKLAGETVTLDHLSNGRTILSVGHGAVDTGFEAFGEITARRIRTELLDEGLDILNGLWQGQPFTYEGRHYRVKPTEFMPPPAPVQQPRIPIWVVGIWPSPKSMARVLRCDGILVERIKAEDGSWRSPGREDVRAIRNFVAANREPGVGRPDFDIVWQGEETPGDDPERAAELVAPLAQAGITWWIESRWSLQGPDWLERLRERILQGPPGI